MQKDDWLDRALARVVETLAKGLCMGLYVAAVAVLTVLRSE